MTAWTKWAVKSMWDKTNKRLCGIDHESSLTHLEHPMPGHIFLAEFILYTVQFMKDNLLSMTG
jgi:hypothetical protein